MAPHIDTSPTAVERLIAFYRANPMAHPAELLEVTEALRAERDTLTAQLRFEYDALMSAKAERDTALQEKDDMIAEVKELRGYLDRNGL